jgi:hypothetical protein
LEILMAIDYDFLRHRLGLTSGGGDTSLALLRQRLERAESELEAARAAMRSAADSAGIKRAGLFSGSAFISRETGEKWADAARNEGWRAGATFFADAVESLRNPDPDDPMYHLALRLNRTGVPPLEEMLAAVTGEGGKGGAILAAGRRARMSADAAGEVPEPEKGSLASRIIEAGRKRRGGI